MISIFLFFFYFLQQKERSISVRYRERVYLKSRERLTRDIILTESTPRVRGYRGFRARYETTSPPSPPLFRSLIRTNPVPMLNIRCTQWSTYRSKIWAMRSPPQKVTGYRYEEETACEQRSRDSKGGYYADPSCLLLPLSLPCLPALTVFRPRFSTSFFRR